jgi:ABC-type polysaccharide/polyol phosphate transport system ATPase subunit
VSFEVKKGETIAIIGPNGSGKSTLLKLLAHITQPTKGELYLNGRVTALMELGAGFHPELTGRENIYLNGAILGLTKKGVDATFKEIVEFAELWDFIDTPVKHYSSGMVVRLGFAVAVYVNPEILLIDEVLAVGDAAFRKRCFERIDTFIREGRTIILVTHNVQDLQRITRRALLIDNGLKYADGPLDEVIVQYTNLMARKWPKVAAEKMEIGRRPAIEIETVEICGADGKARSVFRTHEDCRVKIHYVPNEPVVNPVFRVQIVRNDGLFCHGMTTMRHGIHLGTLSSEGNILLRYPDLGLLQGEYSLHVAVLRNQYDDFPIHCWDGPGGIRVHSKEVDGGGILSMRSEWVINERKP